jgi:ribosomal protein S24E
MKTKIISQEKNPFLEREEFLIEIEANSTPTEAEIIEDLGKGDLLTVIRGIRTNFGTCTFIVDAIVYNSEEAKEKYVVLPQKVRKKIEEEKKAKEEEEKKAKEAAAQEALKAQAQAESEPAVEEKPEETPAAEEKETKKVEEKEEKKEENKEKTE